MAQPLRFQAGHVSARIMKSLQDKIGEGSDGEAKSLLASVNMKTFPTLLYEESKPPSASAAPGDCPASPGCLMKTFQDSSSNCNGKEYKSVLASVDTRTFPTRLFEDSKTPSYGSAAPGYGIASPALLVRTLQDSHLLHDCNGAGGNAPPDACDRQSQSRSSTGTGNGLQPKLLLSSLQTSEETMQPSLAYGSMSLGKTVSSAISAQASTGATTTKVNKRRSRASIKPPITVLSANTANFRAMVQKLTGIPTSPAIHWSWNHPWSNTPLASAIKPQACPPYGIQGLQTLDTSAFLLLDRDSSFDQGLGLPLLQSPQPQPSGNSSNSSNHLKALFPSLMHPMKVQASEYDPASTTMHWDSADYGRKMEISAYHISHDKSNTDMRKGRLLDVMLNGKEKLDADVSDKTLQTIDSWLTSDGTRANHMPDVEIVHDA